MLPQKRLREENGDKYFENEGHQSKKAHKFEGLSCVLPQ